jgi:hypothetical protein
MNVNIYGFFEGEPIPIEADTFGRLMISGAPPTQANLSFFSILATAAGNTTIWTPTSGLRFVLQGYTISVSGTAATTETILIELLDGATVAFQHQATVSAASPAGDTQIGADLASGYNSVAENNVLKVNLSAAFLTGGVAVNAWGYQST